MENTVKVPSFLQEIYGEQSNWFDITTIITGALLAVIAILTLGVDLDIATWKKWVLIALAYDLGSGALANFTYATKCYYHKSRKRRLVFLSLHFLHLIAMYLVFPTHWIGIALFSGYTIVSSFITHEIGGPHKQLTIGVLLSFVGIITLHSPLIELNQPLLLLLTLFLLKLPLSFSISWYRLKKI